MHVQLCWRTKNTTKGKVHVTKTMTIKEATKIYKEDIEPTATAAYLRHFDGWHRRIIKIFKKEEDHG